MNQPTSTVQAFRNATGVFKASVPEHLAATAKAWVHILDLVLQDVGGGERPLQFDDEIASTVRMMRAAERETIALLSDPAVQQDHRLSGFIRASMVSASNLFMSRVVGPHAAEVARAHKLLQESL